MFRARNHHNDPRRQNSSSGKRGNGNSFLSMRSRFDGANVADLFRLGVGYALRRKDEYAKNNEHDTDNRNWFHTVRRASSGPNGHSALDRSVADSSGAI